MSLRLYDDENDIYRTYDTHTLYADINSASEKQIKTIILDAIKQLNKKIDCDIKINIVESKAKKFRCAYIRVSSDEIYYALLGRNLDGSERVKYIDDPNFVHPKKPLKLALDELYNNNDNLNSSSMSWADDIDVEDEIKKQYDCPKISILLDKLVELKPYANNKYIRIGPAYVNDTHEDYNHNILVSFSVPKWVDTNTILFYFGEYVTEKKEYIKAKNGNKISYPIIIFKQTIKGRYVQIKFSPTSDDASFCLLMNKYLTLPIPKYICKGRSKTTHVLKFDYLLHKLIKE